MKFLKEIEDKYYNEENILLYVPWLINRIKLLHGILKSVDGNVGDYNGDYSTTEDYEKWDAIQAKISQALEEES